MGDSVYQAAVQGREYCQTSSREKGDCEGDEARPEPLTPFCHDTRDTPFLNRGTN